MLLFMLSNITCKSHCLKKLEGMWRDKEECPDFIFFHKSGRYIVFNDCQSEHPWVLPIIEKGNWMIEGINKLRLIKDESFRNNNSSFGGEDGLISIINIKNIFQYYQKEKLSANKMQRFDGHGSAIKKLKLTAPGAAILLRLKYKLFYPGAPESEPSELVVEDQAGNELWRRTITFKRREEMEEILIADIPDAINFTHFIFKVNTKVVCTLEAKTYS